MTGECGLNNICLISRLTVGPYRILLAADQENQSSLALVKQFGADLRSDILKVPHHGIPGLSDFSFYKTVAPKFAIISDRHPLWCTEGLLLQRWLKKLGITTLITGVNGNIDIHFTGSLHEGVEYNIRVQKKGDPLKYCGD